jgi:uncharacterized alpha-E superfamily protein
MLCRVADSVYWAARYIERAENVARFIDVNYNLTLGDGETLGNRWDPLVYTTGDHEAFAERFGKATRENVLQFLLFDEKNPNSILSCVSQARENSRTIREVIPSVVWEQLNKFSFMVRAAAKQRATMEQPQEFCERVRLASHLLLGATDSTMSQGEAWHFSRIGRFIERADKTSRIVDVQYFILLPNAQSVGTALDVVRWSALLKSASALVMYRRQHGKIVPNRVADFLILDRQFPRAVHYCLMHAMDSLRCITGSPPGTFCNLSEQLMGRLCSSMDYTSIENVIEQGMHEYIDNFQRKLNQVGGAISKDFLSARNSFQPTRLKTPQMRQTQSS